VQLDQFGNDVNVRCQFLLISEVDRTIVAENYKAFSYPWIQQFRWKDIYSCVRERIFKQALPHSRIERLYTFTFEYNFCNRIRNWMIRDCLIINI